MKGALYEIDDPIRYIIRCYGNAATAAPQVDVLNDSDAIVETHTEGSGLTRIGNSRMFTGSFTPTTQGVWTLHHTDAHGGDTVKSYPVGLKGIQSIAIQVDEVSGKVDDLQEDIDALELVINVLPVRLDDVDTAIAAISVIVSETEGGLITINSAVESVQSDVTTANTKLDTLLAKDPGTSHFG